MLHFESSPDASSSSSDVISSIKILSVPVHVAGSRRCGGTASRASRSSRARGARRAKGARGARGAKPAPQRRRRRRRRSRKRRCRRRRRTTQRSQRGMGRPSPRWRRLRWIGTPRGGGGVRSRRIRSSRRPHSAGERERARERGGGEGGEGGGRDRGRERESEPRVLCLERCSPL